MSDVQCHAVCEIKKTGAAARHRPVYAPRHAHHSVAYGYRNDITQVITTSMQHNRIRSSISNRTDGTSDTGDARSLPFQGDSAARRRCCSAEELQHATLVSQAAPPTLVGSGEAAGASSRPRRRRLDRQRRFASWGLHAARCEGAVAPLYLEQGSTNRARGPSKGLKRGP